MKQTAVEWLAHEINKMNVSNDAKLFISKLEKQAKEMEKIQHQETFNQARLVKIFEKDMPPVWDSWYQYYNETFKSE